MLRLIRDTVPTSCCLAIGDGANDVAMILEGQVGVGIIGKEGMAAVNNSDYAIGQFRFLRGLLLVHGRANYFRVSLFNYYVLYKGMVLPISIFFFSVVIGAASATNIYIDLYYVALFSLFETILPIIITAVADQDIPKSVAAHAPLLYTMGIRRVHFTKRIFYMWFVDGIWGAALAAFLPILCVEAGVDGSADSDFYGLSWASMFICTLGVNARLIPEINSWTVLEGSANGVSLAIVIMFVLVMSFTDYPEAFPSTFSWAEFRDFLPRWATSFDWWIGILLGIFLFTLPRAVAICWTAAGRAHMYARPPPDDRPAASPDMAASATSEQNSMRATSFEGRRQIARAIDKKSSTIRINVGTPTRRVAAPTPYRQSTTMFMPPETEMAKAEEARNSRGPMAHVSRGFAYSSNEDTSRLMFDMRMSGLKKTSLSLASSTGEAVRSASSAFGLDSIAASSGIAVQGTVEAVQGAGRAVATAVHGAVDAVRTSTGTGTGNGAPKAAATGSPPTTSFYF